MNSIKGLPLKVTDFLIKSDGNKKLVDLTRLSVVVQQIENGANAQDFNFLYRDKLWIDTCEKVINEAREILMHIRIKYILSVIAKDDTRKVEKVYVKNDISLLKDAGVGFSGADISINAETIKAPDDLIDACIIEDRMKKINQYYQNSDKVPNPRFETYYATEPAIAGFLQQESSMNAKIEFIENLKKRNNKKNSNTEESGIKKDLLETIDASKKMTMKDRYDVWNGKEITPTNGKIDGKEVDFTWYAYVKDMGIQAIYKINQGHYGEALLHAASSIPPTKKEFLYWEAAVGNKTPKKDSSIKIEGKNILNIDEAIIKAEGKTEFFRGGDVNFLLYQRSGNILEFKIQTYQSKVNRATASLNTLYHGILLLYDYIYGTRLTENVKLYNFKGKKWNASPQEKNKISFNKNLKDVLWEDFTIDIKSEKYQKIIKTLLENRENYNLTPSGFSEQFLESIQFDFLKNK